VWRARCSSLTVASTLNASMPRLPIGDILHRGIVYTCIGTTFWGVYAAYQIHRDTLRRGRGAFFA
jgi:hypothetical protein